MRALGSNGQFQFADFRPSVDNGDNEGGDKDDDDDDENDDDDDDEDVNEKHD